MNIKGYDDNAYLLYEGRTSVLRRERHIRLSNLRDEFVKYSELAAQGLSVPETKLKVIQMMDEADELNHMLAELKAAEKEKK